MDRARRRHLRSRFASNAAAVSPVAYGSHPPDFMSGMRWHHRDRPSLLTRATRVTDADYYDTVVGIESACSQRPACWANFCP